jgi:hypothetical protein
MSNWMNDYLKTDSKLEVEAFSDLPKHYVLADRQGDAPCIAKRGNGGKKFPYAARIDVSIMERLKKCHGSTNSNINALLELALDILDEQNKTLLAE